MTDRARWNAGICLLSRVHKQLISAVPSSPVVTCDRRAMIGGTERATLMRGFAALVISGAGLVVPRLRPRIDANPPTTASTLRPHRH
jgi:hypothetical protein